MALHIGCLTIDCKDPDRLARFWEQALPSTRTQDEDDEVTIETTNGYRILFGRSSDEKTVKNRLHLDLVPDDQDAEVARLEALGAMSVDIGQTGKESWVVLADPEGNEFCIEPAGADSNV